MATYFRHLMGAVKVVTSGGSRRNPLIQVRLLSWSITMTSDTVDSTSMGDTNSHIRKCGSLTTGTAIACHVFWDPDRCNASS